MITPPHARGNRLELQSGGSLEKIRLSSYGTLVTRGHLSYEAFMGSSYFLHSAFEQNAASLSAGMNSLQEVIKCTNMTLNTFQVEQVVVFLAALTQQAARKQVLIHQVIRGQHLDYSSWCFWYIIALDFKYNSSGETITTTY